MGLVWALRLAGAWTQKREACLVSALQQLQALWQLLLSRGAPACLVHFCSVPQKQHGVGPAQAQYVSRQH